jgi:PAS domain-containing protein
MAMVQDPATAEYDRMPLSAIATGLADYVLPVEQMPEVLVQYVQHAYVNGGRPSEQAPESTDSLTGVLALLRASINFDFTPYRKKTLARRVERRMGLNHLDSIPKYLAFVYGTIMSANPATEKMFGYPAAELIGRNVKVLMPAPYREEHDGYLARHLRTGEKRTLDSRGMGMKIRRFRAGLIDAHLSVGAAEPGGAVVTCKCSRGAGNGQEQTQGGQAGGPHPDRR